ncbi:MAG: C40 family peptidase [Actinobacteria bacterium]|nr:C40 family peptidase [Actinomycetota bacterium]
MPESTSGRTRRVAVRSLALALCGISLLSAGDLHATPRRERLDAAKERLYELEKEFELVVERYNATNEKLIEIQSEISATRLVVDELQDRMDARQSDAVSLAKELYMSGGAAIAFESILSAESIGELEKTVEYLRASEQAQAKVFESLAVDRAELNRHIAILEEDRGRAVATEARLSDLRQEIEAKVASQQDEIAELNAAIEAAALRRAEARREAAAAAAVPVGAPSLSVPARPAPAPNPGAQTAVDAALSQVGKPYQWGAEGPDSYDCSGLTLWAWAKAGVSLPHNSGMQQAAIAPVSRDELQPGDLIFFGSPVHHVSMYIGNGQMVEAPYTGQFVRVVPADRWSDFAGAGRPGV